MPNSESCTWAESVRGEFYRLLRVRTTPWFKFNATAIAAPAPPTPAPAPVRLPVIVRRSEAS